MGRAARVLAVVSITASMLAAIATPCSAACACPMRTPKQILKDADAAFIGRVDGVVFLDAGRSIQTFRVEEVYRGVLGPTISVHVGLDADCPPVYYPQGERSAVVARLQPDGSYVVAACDLLLIEDIERFGGRPRAPLPAGETAPPPVPVSPDDGAGRELPFWAVVTIGALVAFAGMALVSRGGRRPRGDDGTPTDDGPAEHATSSEDVSV